LSGAAAGRAVSLRKLGLGSFTKKYRCEEEGMFHSVAALLMVCAVAAPASALAAAREETSASSQPALYFPERNDWRRKRPEDVGMDSARLDEAVKSAVADENPATKNMAFYLATTFDAREPLDTPIGPIKDRGTATSIKAPAQTNALAK
jgi:hypothetical protein